MKRIIFAVLMMVCSVSWAKWDGTPTLNKVQGVKYYHDKSTIRIDGAIAKMWVMRDFSEPQNDNTGGRYKSQKLLFAYDCMSEQAAIISGVNNSDSMGRGSVVWSITLKENEWEWEAIPPKSIGEVNWKIACGKK